MQLLDILHSLVQQRIKRSGRTPGRQFQAIKTLSRNYALLDQITIPIMPPDISPFAFTYDYVIAGGGFTGCILASCLHQNKASLSILHLEARLDKRSNPLVMSPLAAINYSACLALF